MRILLPNVRFENLTDVEIENEVVELSKDLRDNETPFLAILDFIVASLNEYQKGGTFIGSGVELESKILEHFDDKNKSKLIAS